jgi:anti-sigma factor RsiW
MDMAKQVTDDQLEQYVRGESTPAQRRRVDAALRASADLQARLAALRKEHETIEAVKDSFAIRLPEKEEERIVSRAAKRLGTTLGPATELSGGRAS